VSGAKRVLLLVDADGAGPGSPAALLEQALRAEGAEVRCAVLGAPYGGVLDALAEGWMPVRLPAAAPGAPPN